MLFLDTRTMVNHGVDNIVAAVIIKEINKTFLSQNWPK